MYKIVLINEAFQKEYYSRRWQLFADRYKDFDVTLLTPESAKWYNNKQYTYEGSKTEYGKNVDNGNFHIRTFRINFLKLGWVSWDFKKILLQIHPDVVYHIGTHTMLSVVQIGRIVKKYLPQTKLALFSMRGPNWQCIVSDYKFPSMEWFRNRYLHSYGKFVIKYENKNYNAIFCHYPDAADAFRRDGFNGSLYMQTQVGVNTEWFHPSEEARKEIREKYKIGNSFLFGSASRFTIDKGLDDILDALPDYGDWKYMMMGTGSKDDIERLKTKIRERGFENKVIMPGFVDIFEIAKYWNAVDCAIHVPRTTKHWVETFSLAAIQPQATLKPVIGNTSGSVPYQVGMEEMIVKEGDIESLRERILWVMEHPKEVTDIAKKQYKRTIDSFSVERLNNLFYDTLVQDIIPGNYDLNKYDMTKYLAS